MTDFAGTQASDTIIEKDLDSRYTGSINALGGDDVIVAKSKSVLPGPGADVVVAYSPSVNAIYWDALSTVQINLRAVVVSGGHGGADTLQNVRTVMGTRLDDVFIA